MSTTHKYFWLKLKRDFFKRHDIRIIEAMPNGKDYVLFYLKLLTESIDHEGRLRFSDTIPYNLEMLSTITDTNIDIVRTAVKLFVELEMMEQLDDGTLYMSQVATMIGSETSEAVRKREARERPKQFLTEQEKGGHCPDLSAPCPDLSGNCPPELELDIEIEKDKENTGAPQSGAEPTPKSTRFVKPTVEEIWTYCQGRKNRVDAQHFWDFYESKGWKIGKTPMKDWRASVRTWERNESDRGGNHGQSAQNLRPERIIVPDFSR